ncbi:LysM peptidoglycan-binding domain-containing protein [Nonomuraea cavernae]|uniref:LysM peptidoglycan-binding domain-containing protein n=1 Tax=Nonomuraea cavernae TaxID=2045107 RepID=UPI00166B03BF|nr:LysM peptidoglycan-binding domain-containing protein [Nonomuraea cavernae]MCA2189619.1 LysM peptidoglycan-binding domain-containing protein [Nonomuraea cavernae]
MRLTRRGRAVLVVGMALLSLGGFWLGTRTASHAASTPAVTGHSWQVGLPWEDVRRGDTLWKIAEAVTPQFGDPGVFAEEIRRLNRLPDLLVRPGARVYLPPGVEG